MKTEFENELGTLTPRRLVVGLVSACAGSITGALTGATVFSVLDALSWPSGTIRLERMDLIVEGAMIGFGAGIACVAGLWHAFVLREYLPGGRKGFIEVVTSSFCCFWITASHAIVGFGVGAIYFNVVSNPNFLGAVVGLFVGGLLGCMIWLLTWLASKLAVRIQ